MIKDYDCVIDYYLGKVNVVKHVLSRSLLVLLFKIRAIQTSLHNEWRSWPVEMMIDGNNHLVAHLKVKPIHLDKIRETKNNDPMMVKLKNYIDS